jgi:hypothetical protein
MTILQDGKFWEGQQTLQKQRNQAPNAAIVTLKNNHRHLLEARSSCVVIPKWNDALPKFHWTSQFAPLKIGPASLMPDRWFMACDDRD